MFFHLVLFKVSLWEITKFLISNRSVIQLINGDFCVINAEKAFNVKERKSHKLTYTCGCTKFQQLICSHVMAVAERKSSLSYVLEYYQEQGANTNKIMCYQTGRWEITPEKTQKREKQHSKRTNNNSQYCRDQYTYRSRTWC